MPHKSATHRRRPLRKRSQFEPTHTRTVNFANDRSLPHSGTPWFEAIFKAMMAIPRHSARRGA